MKKEVIKYTNLIQDIGNILEEGRQRAVTVVNNILVNTYWLIGKQIVEFEQKGKERAKYGSQLLKKLSKDLKLKYGRGFSRRNIQSMRLLYLKYPKCQTLSGITDLEKGKCQIVSDKSHMLAKKFQTLSGKSKNGKWQTLSAKLGWSHYIELLGIDNDLERRFYENQCINEKWSVRQLRRQINSALFQRLALSKDKEGIMELSKIGEVIKNPKDLVRDPYILEFLKIPQSHKLTEKGLEQNLIDNLQMFLLELGKGFTFVARQFRISLGNKHFYVDLVFYHRILKCFVLFDLKIGEASHKDIGQMNLYLNYFKKEENTEKDNEPIGIILSARKNDISMEFALGGISNKLFVSKYKLYLPDKKELENNLKKYIE